MEPSKKIACICNINHAQFILARYLRDMGHDVTLFLMEEYPNFYPENDTYGPVEGIKVVELPWKHKELFKVSRSEIKAKLGGFDMYCASEFAPAFLYKAGLPLHIFIPIGTDLIDYPFQKPEGLIPPTWAMDEYQFNVFQKKSIQNSGAIFMNQGGDRSLENALLKIKFRGRRYPMSLPYLYLPDYESEKAVSPYGKQIQELRNKNTLMLISHGRCEFLNKNSVHYKGTEMMIEGLAKFIQSGNKDTCLVMLEYGNDWPAAKQLAAELGIAENIHWLPKSGRKDIFPILKYFDAGFGTISYPHWSYNVAIELVAAGVPVIRNGATVQGDDIYQYYKAVDSNSVFDVLGEIKNSEKSKPLSTENWYQKRNAKVLELLKEYLEKFTSEVTAPKGFVFSMIELRRQITILLGKLKYRIVKTPA